MNIFDLHQDLLLYVSRPDLYADRCQTSFEQLRKNGVKIVIASCFVVPDDNNFSSPETIGLIERDLMTYNEYCKEHRDFIIIRDISDLEIVLNNSELTGLILHIEGLNYFDEKTDWKTLEQWHDLGLRSIGPLWNINNPFGGGTLDQERGLTELGKQLIAWCEKRGVVFDFAHMNEKTFWEAADVVTRPILVSHGNARSLCPDQRNYTDEQLKKIQATGGAIGFFLSSKFIGQPANIESVVKHILHMKECVGEDGVAIGSDYGGITSGTPLGLESIDDLPGLLETFDEPFRSKLAYANAVRVIKNHLTQR